jgi:hypothetical protein
MSELLFTQHHALYERLPRSYRTGGSLPPLRPLPLNFSVAAGTAADSMRLTLEK